MQLGNPECASCVDREKEWCQDCHLIRLVGRGWGMSKYRPRNGQYTITTNIDGHAKEGDVESNGQ